MSLLIETIKLVDGKFRNLFHHEQRMIRSLETLCGVEEDIVLEEFLHELSVPQQGVFKCRIVYDDQTKEVEFIPYEPRSVKSLKIVESDRIKYDFKYADRRQIDKLFENRHGCDDILIIKKAEVTDASYANIVFRRDDEWVTPWSPLLKGTMRQKLLDENKIVAEKILLEDIPTFQSCKLINAMLEFDAPEIDVSNIVS
ncbi:MAG TPA: aminotransferase class IV [Sphingobacteriaceae bacterium]